MAKARAMVEGSLRELGATAVGIDRLTHARLKRLAGDTPLCLKVKELVEEAERRELPGGGGQVPLPGQERLVSPNTIAALSSEVRSLSVMVQELQVSVRQDGEYIENKLEPLRLAILRFFGSKEDTKAVKATGETEQLELRTS